MSNDDDEVEKVAWRVPFRNRWCDEFVTRELANPDEVEAGRAARTRGPFLSPEEMQRAVFLEEVAMSIVAVRRPGSEVFEDVEPPFAEFHRWPARLRVLAVNAYKRLNSIEDEDMAVFHAGARPWPQLEARPSTRIASAPTP